MSVGNEDIGIDKNGVLENCRKNLDRNRAVATGIGVFVAIIQKEEKNVLLILLRKRQEKWSLYGQDLSQKWELIGGGIELNDFSTQVTTQGTDYTAPIWKGLKRELYEEGGLNLSKLPEKLIMGPAWMSKNGIIDVAFVVPISWEYIEETPEFKKKLAEGELGFFSQEEIEKLDVVSSRMRFLIKTGFSLYSII